MSSDTHKALVAHLEPLRRRRRRPQEEDELEVNLDGLDGIIDAMENNQITPQPLQNNAHHNLPMMAPTAQREATPHITIVSWDNLSQTSKTIILKELANHFESFQAACETLSLESNEVQAFLDRYEFAKEQTIKWEHHMERWRQYGEMPDENDNALGAGINTIKPECIKQMCEYLDFMGLDQYSHLVTSWENRNVLWPPSIHKPEFNCMSLYTNRLNALLPSSDRMAHGARRRKLSKKPARLQEAEEALMMGFRAPKRIHKDNTAQVRVSFFIIPAGTIVLGPAGWKKLLFGGTYRVVYQDNGHEDQANINKFVISAKPFNQPSSGEKPGKPTPHQEGQGLNSVTQHNDNGNNNETNESYVGSDEDMDSSSRGSDHDYWQGRQVFAELIQRVQPSKEPDKAQQAPKVDHPDFMAKVAKDIEELEDHEIAIKRLEEVFMQGLTMESPEAIRDRQSIPHLLQQEKTWMLHNPEMRIRAQEPSIGVKPSEIFEDPDELYEQTHYDQLAQSHSHGHQEPKPRERKDINNDLAKIRDSLLGVMYQMFLPHGYMIELPTGYLTNFDTNHQGPNDGVCPPGTGGQYTFVLPDSMRVHIDSYKTTPLPRRTLFRAYIPEDVKIFRDGEVLPTMLDGGCFHHFSIIENEMETEMDIITEYGRHYIFDQQPIPREPVHDLQDDSSGDDDESMPDINEDIYNEYVIEEQEDEPQVDGSREDEPGSPSSIDPENDNDESLASPLREAKMILGSNREKFRREMEREKEEEERKASQEYYKMQRQLRKEEQKNNKKRKQELDTEELEAAEAESGNNTRLGRGQRKRKKNNQDEKFGFINYSIDMEIEDPDDQEDWEPPKSRSRRPNRRQQPRPIQPAPQGPVPPAQPATQPPGVHSLGKLPMIHRGYRVSGPGEPLPPVRQSGTASGSQDYPHLGRPIPTIQHRGIPIPDAPPKRGRGRPRLNPLPQDPARPWPASPVSVESRLAMQEGRPLAYTDAQLEEMGILDRERAGPAGAGADGGRALEPARDSDAEREEGTEENPYVL
ncbi:hypothetical protein F4810DRAFT_722091 [Camillea tinctor]|nr:hypothetical protein F4810DRAFT_722091 [Camillea tinctor]